MGEEPSDRELIDRYVSGDRVAFAVLVRRHERRVFNLAYRLLGREEDARDATQDAFLTALRKLSSFRGEAAFTTWLHRVTVNACYDILRKRKREPTIEVPEGQEAAADPVDHADTTALSIDVQRALLTVPQEFRVAVILHDIQDLAYEDIAETLGVPVGTVKSRIHRGRVALARALGGFRAGSSPPTGTGAADDSERTPRSEGERPGASRPSEERTVQ